MKETISALKKKAADNRITALRMANIAGGEGAHIGPAFSIMDIMTVLYAEIINYREEEPDWSERDRVILSKGHACLGLYAPLYMRHILSQEQLKTFNQQDTKIAGHPSGKGISGIEHPAGSLGHGLSVACGIAKGAKMDGRQFDTYVIVGDGECNEGSIWEGVMFAAQNKLDNLTCIVDVNGYQYGGSTKDLMNLCPLEDKWRSFGWNVSVVNGHDPAELCEALDKKNRIEGMPKCIIAKTVKGYGVKIFEGNDWHHGIITNEVMKEAIEELQKGETSL